MTYHSAYQKLDGWCTNNILLRVIPIMAFQSIPCSSCQATSARRQPDICNILWHYSWHMYLANLLTFFLAFYLVYLRRFFVVEVRRGTLWSGARGWGPAGNTLIRSLRWRSGGEHSDLELAVGVRRGTLWSGACGGGVRRRKEEEGGPADIKSNSPHLLLKWLIHTQILPNQSVPFSRLSP